MKQLIKKPGKYVYILKKEGGTELVEGKFHVKKNEKIRVETDLVFEAKRCWGKVWLKGVVEPGGLLEFSGKIKIKKSGQHSDGFLKQEILLLGSGAIGLALPELEIETNEVKASHAASVSYLDAEQLFYLQSRGVRLPLAKKLLVAAFLEEIK